MPNLFTIVLRNDDIQEIDSKWDEILLSMTHIPSDDILGGLYKIKDTRVWETQDRVGFVQFWDSSEESWTWLWAIEDNGKKKHRAGIGRDCGEGVEFTNEEFWSQKG